MRVPDCAPSPFRRCAFATATLGMLAAALGWIFGACSPQATSTSAAATATEAVTDCCRRVGGTHTREEKNSPIGQRNVASSEPRSGDRALDWNFGCMPAARTSRH